MHRETSSGCKHSIRSCQQDLYQSQKGRRLEIKGENNAIMFVKYIHQLKHVQ